MQHSRMDTHAPLGRQQAGFALLSVFGLTFIIGVLAAGVYGLVQQEMHTAQRARDYLKARVIAEAGANTAYNLIKYNYAARLNPNNFPAATFGGGDYTLTLTTNFADTARTRILSVGRCRAAEARVMLDLRNLQQQASANGEIIAAAGFGCAILAGGNINWSGGGYLDGDGLVHCNGALLLQGNGSLSGEGLEVESSVSITLKGSSEILGDVTAPIIEGTKDIDGEVTIAAVPMIAVPIIDLSPYYQHALANGQVYNGNMQFNADFTPPGGVVWVNGSLKLPNGSFTGCFIATGDIDSSTGDSLTSVNSYPLLVSRDGSITITSTPDIEGLVYAQNGSVKWTGGGDLTGAIICAGTLDKGGGSDLHLAYSDPTPATPGGDSLADCVVVTAWQ